MPITLTHAQTQSLLLFEGDITISSAAELKNLILEALASRRELRVDLGKVSDLDVTIWQLLWAAERETRGRGTGFTVVGNVPEEIFEASRAIGFEKFPFPIERL
jgi:anti-anti-sigma regulatory factor